MREGKREEPKRVNVLGCPFDGVSMSSAVSLCREALRRSGLAPESSPQFYVGVGNVDMVMKMRSDPTLKEYFWKADLVITDGMPVVWAARLLRLPLMERVSGTEFVVQLARLSAESGRSVAIVGGRLDSCRRAAEKLERVAPGSRFVPLDTPYPLTPAGSEALAEEIREIGAGIVLVALGAPKQELWLREYLPSTGAVVGVGVGSAFDILSGDKRWAPKWMRKAGLEWLYRMLQEPRRLGRRYLIDDLPFLWLILRALVQGRPT